MNLFDFILLCCNKVWCFLKMLGVFLLQLIRFALHYWWILLFCAVLGGFLGWLWVKPFATLFSGRATVMYAEGMREVVQEGVVDFLNLPYEVKVELGVHPDLLESLQRVYMYNVIDCNGDSVVDFIDMNRKISLSDTTDLVMRDRMCIEVKLLGYCDFHTFQIGLSNFLNTRDYALKIHEQCKIRQKEKLDYLIREFARLDSFSTYAYFNRPHVSSVNVVNAEEYKNIDNGLYYRDVKEVLKEKSFVEMQYLSTPSVVNFQTPFIYYAMPPIFKYLIGLVVGGVMGLLLALVVKYWGVIVAYMKEK